jgi:hypothetical protein
MNVANPGLAQSVQVGIVPKIEDAQFQTDDGAMGKLPSAQPSVKEQSDLPFHPQLK